VGGSSRLWIGIGFAAQFSNAWVMSGATLAFGAMHSSIVNWVVGGRQRTPRLRIRRDVAGHFTPILVLGSLCAFVVVTIVGALVAHANGVKYPVLVSSVAVAALILIVGPLLMRSVRRLAKTRKSVS
jgi:putative Ca2+/H+ antiporter (TMEM165/GDT1 family)